DGHGRSCILHGDVRAFLLHDRRSPIPAGTSHSRSSPRLYVHVYVHDGDGRVRNRSFRHGDGAHIHSSHDVRVRNHSFRRGARVRSRSFRRGDGVHIHSFHRGDGAHIHSFHDDVRVRS